MDRERSWAKRLPEHHRVPVGDVVLETGEEVGLTVVFRPPPPRLPIAEDHLSNVEQWHEALGLPSNLRARCCTLRPNGNLTRRRCTFFQFFRCVPTRPAAACRQAETNLLPLRKTSNSSILSVTAVWLQRLLSDSRFWSRVGIAVLDVFKRFWVYRAME